MSMPEKSIKLFQENNIVFLATMMKDGSPQVTPVWADYQDGHILVNTAEGRLKHKNVLRDPRVAVSVVSANNFLDMTSVRGKIVDIIPDHDYTHADKLTKQYLNREHYPFKQEGEKRIIFKIKPERVFVMPELKLHDN